MVGEEVAGVGLLQTEVVEFLQKVVVAFLQEVEEVGVVEVGLLEEVTASMYCYLKVAELWNLVIR